MREPTPLAHQVAAQRDDRLSVLVGLPVAFDTVVERVDGQVPAKAVLLESGTRHEVTADGLNSGVRALLLRPQEVTPADTGWGGWVAWSPPDEDPDLYEEVWGDAGPRLTTALDTVAAARLVTLQPVLGPILRLLADRPGRQVPDPTHPHHSRRTP